MNPRVVGELGMKGGSHDLSLPNDDRIVAFRGKHFNPGADAFNLGRANENHFHRRGFSIRIKPLPGSNGTIDLPSIGVAADGDIERPQSRLLGVLNFLG